MYSKVALISCLIGLASAGALLNSGNHNQWDSQVYAQGNYGAYNGYAHQGGYQGGYNGGYAGYNNLEGYNANGAGYAAQPSGAVSHVSITREITPSVPYSTGHGAHGYGNHGLGYANNGYAGAYGHGAAYNGAYGQGIGYSGAYGYGAGAHGQGLGYANAVQGYGSAYGAHGQDLSYNGAHGYNHAISTVSQHSIHKNPVVQHYGSHSPNAYGASGQYAHPTSYSNLGYGSNAW